LAQAKTGTGKTLAFLLPVVQNILLQDSSLERRNRVSLRSNASDIRAIIISPTRELAEQIAVEARKIVSSTGVIIQTAVGGTQKREGLRRIQREGCHILVGTPGRLKDILSDPTSGVKTPKLNSFVLDEADRLLDEGFAPDIEEIASYLPDPMKVDRQTLMFSATVPREVMGMVRKTMKPDFKFVRTVKEDEVPTHLAVPQKLIFLRGLENAMPAVLEIAKNYTSRRQQDSSLRPFKAIVYFNCTADVQLAYEVFRELRTDPTDRHSGHPLGETRGFSIHSRLTQMQRTRSSQNFRTSTSAILFSSDVTARGMDFPDVTHVIQIGSPRQRESYIHRLGRTARANKTGEGWILLHDEEFRDFKQKLGDLPIKRDTTSLQTADVNMGKPDQALPAPVAETLSQLGAAMKQVPYETKAASYTAQISVLTPTFDSKRDVIRALNNLALNGWGMTEPPAMGTELAGKLGIARVAGVNLRNGEGFSDDASGDRPSSFSSSRGGRGGSFGDRSGGRRNSSDGFDRYERRDRPERSGRRQFDRTDRYQRSDRSDRSDRGGRQDRRERVESNDF
jgi:ATP-dependent RNA helicase MSS116